MWPLRVCDVAGRHRPLTDSLTGHACARYTDVGADEAPRAAPRGSICPPCTPSLTLTPQDTDPLASVHLRGRRFAGDFLVTQRGFLSVWHAPSSPSSPHSPPGSPSRPVPHVPVGAPVPAPSPPRRPSIRFPSPWTRQFRSLVQRSQTTCHLLQTASFTSCRVLKVPHVVARVRGLSFLPRRHPASGRTTACASFPLLTGAWAVPAFGRAAL